MGQKFYFKHLILLSICFTTFITSCKKQDTTTTPTEAEVNFAGAVADPSASFTPFQLPSGGGTSIPASYDFTRQC
jgi:hypothetical protein